MDVENKLEEWRRAMEDRGAEDRQKEYFTRCPMYVHRSLDWNSNINLHGDNLETVTEFKSIYDRH